MDGTPVGSVRSQLEVFEDVAAFTPAAFARLGQPIQDAWIVEALTRARGHATLRRRKLPVDRTLWLVIGMALFRDRSIHEVAERLELALPGAGDLGGIAGSAIPNARTRLGAEAVQGLFDLSAQHWARTEGAGAPWRGLQLFGIDGVCLRVPDTAENDAAFGRPDGGRGGSGYPQVRVVVLMALRAHVLARMSVGAFADGEQTLVEPLWAHVPDHSLTLMDRGFLSWWPLWRLSTSGEERHWLVRAKANLCWRTVTRLGRGDAVVEIAVPRALRRAHPEMPETFQVRAVRRQVKGFRPSWVLTSALDPARYPASELAQLYHERWEIELAYDEVKTHLLERREALRSKKPEGIRQELAGIGLAYNLVRLEMAQVAAQLNVPPTRISFLHTLHAVQDFMAWSWSTSPGALPRRVESHDRRVRLYVLPERRTARRNPRHVKIKMSNYPRNRGRGGAVLK
jgi:hypothetical protein